MAEGGSQGIESMMDSAELKCPSDISSTQEDILARSSFLGVPLEEVEQPPITQQDPVIMCTLPFSQSQFSVPLDDDDTRIKPRQKPRVCTRKVRGARIRTSSPSPNHHQPQHQQGVDSLYAAVLMIPTATTGSSSTNQSNPIEDFVALARQRGFY